MHPLIDAAMVDTIHETGNTSRNLPDRVPILESWNLPYDREAENVIVTGCQILGAMPQMLRALADILEQGGVSHTFLSREYCCGNNLYRPAIKAKDDGALAECRTLSREFVGRNIEAAQTLGAQRIIVFCSPCYPIYRHAFPEAKIVFYPRAISDTVSSLRWDGRIDYYPGCYRLHRKFSPVPMDLASTNELFGKINGLSIHRISAPECCYKPEGREHMMSRVETDCMVHICTGCYFQALMSRPDARDLRILMLPEFIRMVQAG